MELSSREADSRFVDIPDYDVARGNDRFLKNDIEEFASKLWEKATLFGAQGGVSKSSMVVLIEVMEQWDKSMKVQKTVSKEGKL